ncbi:MAG: type II secretion system protein GspG [Planctomycetota bacterium]
MRTRQRKLLGLVVTLAVAAGIISGLYFGIYRPQQERRMSKAETRYLMGELTGIVLHYQINNGALPTEAQMAEMLTASGNGWPIKDAWGNPIQYDVDSKLPEGYVFISLGSDGQPGGSGDAEDIRYTHVPD